MPKTKISEFSATPANNTDIDSINIAEGCAPSGINDAIRELMAQLKDFQTGAVGDSFNGPINGTVGATTPAAGAFTTLAASSTVSGTGFSTYLASPPAIGGTAAAAVSATTLAASGAVTLSGGTANGVTYLNGSKVLTSGSALVFDGTNLGVGTSSPTTLLDLARSSTSGSDATMPNLFVRNTSGTQGNGSSTFNQSIVKVDAGNGTVTGGIRAAYDSAGSYGTGMQLYVNSTNPLQFYTNGSERARIDSSGNLLVGTTSFTSSTTVSNGIFGGNFRSLRSNATIPASSTATVMTLSSSVTGVYIVNANFGATGNAIYGGMLIVVANSGSFRIVTNGGGSSSALSMSGANVQITNALGVPLDGVASAIFIGN